MGSSFHRTSGDSNRRILKTVRPVVWEGAGAQSPALDPIQANDPDQLGLISKLAGSTSD